MSKYWKTLNTFSSIEITDAGGGGTYYPEGAQQYQGVIGEDNFTLRQCSYLNVLIQTHQYIKCKGCMLIRTKDTLH